jgi:exodeoxyribonuclease VIII
VNAVQLRATGELADELARPEPPSPSLLSLAPGRLHLGVHEDTYHQRILGVVSKGAADKVIESLATYRAWVAGEGTELESKALAFGSLAHCFTLQPDVFATKYVAEPDFGRCMKHDDSGTTKEQGAENKRRRDAWRAEHRGATWVSAKDLATVQGMREALYRSPDVGPYLRALWDGRDGYYAEGTCVWECGESGLLCKSRPDLLVDGGALLDETVVLDLKTCADCREYPWSRARAEYNYHRQEAHYRDGAEAVGRPPARFLFVAIEKTPPYLHQVYELDSVLVEYGREQMRRAKAALVSALTYGEWPGLEPGVKRLGPLPWEKP